MIREYSRRRNGRGGWATYLLTITVLGGALLLYGCGDSSLMSGDASTDEESTYFFDQPFEVDEFAKRTDLTVDTSFVVVEYLTALEGGVLMMDDAQDLAKAEALVVQPLSFPADTVFYIEVTKIVTSDDNTPIIYDFQPDGLTFSQPAILRVNAWLEFGKKAEEVYLYHLNETTNKWELEAIVPVDASGMSYLQIPHFSRWGADDPPRGPIGGGGQG